MLLAAAVQLWIKYLSIEGVGMSFGASKILSGIDLTIRKGEFVTLIGHSGCGKSTLLNLVAGLLKPTAGAILLAGQARRRPGPDRGVVFQNHSLLPWLTCFENVHLAVERVFNDRRKEEPSARWSWWACRTPSTRYPHQISGGMKQRVGIARAAPSSRRCCCSTSRSARSTR